MKRFSEEELQEFYETASEMKESGRVNISALCREFGISDYRVKKLLSEEGILKGVSNSQEKWEQVQLEKMPDEALVRKAWESSKKKGRGGRETHSAQRTALLLNEEYDVVKVWLRHLGLLQGKGAPVQVDFEKMVKLYVDEEKTMASIAEELGVTEALVQRRLTQAGVQARPRGGSRARG